MSCPQTRRARADRDPPGPSLRAFLRWGRGPAPGPLRADQLDQLPCMPPLRLFDEPLVFDALTRTAASAHRQTAYRSRRAVGGARRAATARDHTSVVSDARGRLLPPFADRK